MVLYIQSSSQTGDQKWCSTRSMTLGYKKKGKTSKQSPIYPTIVDVLIHKGGIAGATCPMQAGSDAIACGCLKTGLLGCDVILIQWLSSLRDKVASLAQGF